MTDVLDAAFSLASWTCTGQNGGECSANGIGNIDTLVDLPEGVSDDDLDKNVASDGPDVIGLFHNGFE